MNRITPIDFDQDGDMDLAGTGATGEIVVLVPYRQHFPDIATQVCEAESDESLQRLARDPLDVPEPPGHRAGASGGRCCRG